MISNLSAPCTVALGTRRPTAIDGSRPTPPRVHVVLEVVAAKHQVRVADIQGPKLTPAFVVARDEAAWRLRQLQPQPSLNQVGRWLGGRHHTTVLEAARRHADRLPIHHSAREPRSMRTPVYVPESYLLPLQMPEPEVVAWSGRKGVFLIKGDEIIEAPRVEFHPGGGKVIHLPKARRRSLFGRLFEEGLLGVLRASLAGGAA